jgi:drug/metabolite transporter (DMT)-like permease
VLLPARLCGVLLVTIPLAARGRLHIERAVAPALVVAGLAEIVGFLCLGIGTRTDIAITSVLASQFAAFAAIGAVLLFGERRAPSRRWASSGSPSARRSSPR